jgi:hypothetical protein
VLSSWDYGRIIENSDYPHTSFVDHIKVELDGVTVIDLDKPRDYYALGTYYNRTGGGNTWFGHAGWNADRASYPQCSIRSLRSDPLGRVGMMQLCEWNRAARLLVTSDRFRSYEAYPIIDAGVDGGFVTWGAANYEPSSGWHAYYILNKKLYHQPLNGDFSLCSGPVDIGQNLPPFGTAGTYYQSYTNEKDNILIPNNELSAGMVRVHPLYGLVVDGMWSGTQGGTGTLAGLHEQASWCFVHRGESWQAVGTASIGGYNWPYSMPGYSDMNMHPMYGYHISPRYDVAATGLVLDEYSENDPTWNIPASRKRLEDTTWGALSYWFSERYPHYFKLAACDIYHYLYVDDNIWESDDGFNYTANSRIPYWWNP